MCRNFNGTCENAPNEDLSVELIVDDPDDLWNMLLNRSQKEQRTTEEMKEVRRRLQVLISLNFLFLFELIEMASDAKKMYSLTSYTAEIQITVSSTSVLSVM